MFAGGADVNILRPMANGEQQIGCWKLQIWTGIVCNVGNVWLDPHAQPALNSTMERGPELIQPQTKKRYRENRNKEIASWYTARLLRTGRH